MFMEKEKSEPQQKMFDLADVMSIVTGVILNETGIYSILDFMTGEENRDVEWTLQMGRLCREELKRQFKELENPEIEEEAAYLQKNMIVLGVNWFDDEKRGLMAQNDLAAGWIARMKMKYKNEFMVSPIKQNII